MTGQGPLAIREVARRVGRDVNAVHGDVHALIDAGLLDKTEKNHVVSRASFESTPRSSRAMMGVKWPAPRWSTISADCRRWHVIARAIGTGHNAETRYLNVTDGELRRGLEVSGNNQDRPLRALSA